MLEDGETEFRVIPGSGICLAFEGGEREFETQLILAYNLYGT